MSGNVGVQNFPPAMLNDQEPVQQFGGQRRYSEKVERDDRLAMIGEKCLPALIVLARPGPQASEIPGDGAFGDVEAELSQLSRYPLTDRSAAFATEPFRVHIDPGRSERILCAPHDADSSPVKIP
jgi:hypothetical protein